MSFDVNQLRTHLENELLQRIGVLQNNSAITSDLNKLTGITKSNSPDKLEFKQSLTNGLEDKEIILLTLFKEFTKKDEGKVLAAELGKFARYVQSEIAKSTSN
jgi:hypothetical protein